MLSRIKDKISPKTARKIVKTDIIDVEKEFIKKNYPDVLMRREALDDIERIFNRQYIDEFTLEDFWKKYLEHNTVRLPYDELYSAREILYARKDTDIVNILTRLNNVLVRMTMIDEKSLLPFISGYIHVGEKIKNRKETAQLIDPTNYYYSESESSNVLDSKDF